ncbi:hypothetical protein OTU49_008574, partial [Cherax quadricarinatus]
SFSTTGLQALETSNDESGGLEALEGNKEVSEASTDAIKDTTVVSEASTGAIKECSATEVSEGSGGEVVVVGGSGATTLYSREDGSTVLESADGTTTVLRPQGSATTHRLTVTVEGGTASMTAIVDGQTGRGTVVKGAEVVHTQAVSYATPILHHVLLQPTATGRPQAYTGHSVRLHSGSDLLSPVSNTTATRTVVLPGTRSICKDSSRLVEMLVGK